MISASALQKIEALAIVPGTVFMLEFMFYPTWRLFAGATEDRNMALLGVVQILVLFCTLVLWRTLLMPHARWPGGRVKVQKLALLGCALSASLIARAYLNKAVLTGEALLDLRLGLIALAFAAVVAVSLHQFYKLMSRK